MAYSYNSRWEKTKRYLRKWFGKRTFLDRITDKVPIEEIKQLIKTGKVPEIDDLNIPGYERGYVKQWNKNILWGCIEAECSLFDATCEMNFTRDYPISKEVQQATLAIVSYLIEKDYLEIALFSLDSYSRFLGTYEIDKKFTKQNYRSYIEKKKYWEPDSSDEKTLYLLITPKGKALYSKIKIIDNTLYLMKNYQKELSYTFPSLTKEVPPPISHTYPSSWQNFKRYIRKIRGKETILDRIITYVPIEEVKQLIQTKEIAAIDDLTLPSYGKETAKKWIGKLLLECITEQNIRGYCSLWYMNRRMKWEIHHEIKGDYDAWEGKTSPEALQTAITLVCYLIEKEYIEAVFCTFEPDKIEKITKKNYRPLLEKKKHWEFVSWWENCLGLLITPKGRALQKKFEVVEKASSLMEKYQKELA